MKLFKALSISLGIIFSIVAIGLIFTMIFILFGYIWFLVIDVLFMVTGFTCLIYSSMKDKEKLKKELEELNNG